MRISAQSCPVSLSSTWPTGRRSKRWVQRPREGGQRGGRRRHEDRQPTRRGGGRPGRVRGGGPGGGAGRIEQTPQSPQKRRRGGARLYLVEQFDHAEIAAMTGLSEGTIRS